MIIEDINGGPVNCLFRFSSPIRRNLPSMLGLEGGLQNSGVIGQWAVKGRLDIQSYGKAII